MEALKFWFDRFIIHFTRKKKPQFILDMNDPAILDLSKLPKSKTKIADEYGVSIKTLNKWFADKNLKIPKGLICPCDLRKIYASLGPPMKPVKPESK